MFELIMMYCLSGEPCTQETLAIFPQPDVGLALCEIARPAIASSIRAKAPERATVTFSCSDSAMPSVPGYRPMQRKDERYRMIDAGGGSAAQKVIELLDRFAR